MVMVMIAKIKLASATNYPKHCIFFVGNPRFYGSDNTPEEDSDVLTGMEQLSGRTDHGRVEVDIA